MNTEAGEKGHRILENRAAFPVVGCQNPTSERVSANSFRIPSFSSEPLLGTADAERSQKPYERSFHQTMSADHAFNPHLPFSRPSIPLSAFRLRRLEALGCG